MMAVVRNKAKIADQTDLMMPETELIFNNELFSKFLMATIRPRMANVIWILMLFWASMFCNSSNLDSFMDE